MCIAGCSLAQCCSSQIIFKAIYYLLIELVMDVSAKQIADFYGKTGQTVQNWVKAGMPVKHKGSAGVASVFESQDVAAWITEREIKSRVRSSSAGDFDFKGEEARLKHHQANNEKIKEDENRGRLIDTKLVIEICGAGVTVIRNKLLSVEKKIRTKFPGLGDEVYDVIYRLHEQALTELGKGGIPRGLEASIQKYLAECETAT